jgi:hypothetical protein
MPTERLDDGWEPMPRADFESRLKAEIAGLPGDLLKIYREHATAIAEQPCFRSPQYGAERVFVVARSGTRLLIFDDVEDEFAIGVTDEDGVLKDWGLYGDLIDALRAL